jgi:hypothetical protein
VVWETTSKRSRLGLLPTILQLSVMKLRGSLGHVAKVYKTLESVKINT